MRQIMVSVAVLLAGVVAMAVPPQIVVFTDEDGATSAQARAVTGGGIDAGGWTAGAGGGARGVFALRSPDRSAVAVGLLDASGDLMVRPFTDGGFGSPVAVATGVSMAHPAPVAAGYASRSGRLVIAYGVTGSSECLVRSLDGDSVSGASSVPLGLSSAPVRVVVAPSPGSDDVLIVAHDSSQRLGAAIWDGSEFRAADLVDSGFDGGVNRWDAVWTRSGGPIMAWARAGDTALRVRRLVGGAWESMGSTPAAPGAIGRVVLAADGARGGVGVAAAMVSGAGRLEVSVLEGGAWSMPALMTTALDAGKDQPVGLMYEGTGGGLVCAWLESGSDRVHTRRLAGSTWEGATSSEAIGAELTELRLGPDEDDAGVIVLARTESGGGGGGGESLSEYVAYAQGGNFQHGDRVTITGLHGSQIDGMGVPAAPAGNAGVVNIAVGHDQTRTLDPGAYGNLSFGDRSRLHFAAGTYIFNRALSTGHDVRFICDTSGGDVAIVFTTGAVTFRDRFRVERNGAGVVSIHAKAGALRLGHDCNVEAALLAHADTLTLGDRARVTGHLFGASSIAVGHDAVIGLPTWPLPPALGGGDSVVSQRVYAMMVPAGVPGPVVELTTAAIEGPTPVALTVSWPPVLSSTRVVRWREVERE